MKRFTLNMMVFAFVALASPAHAENLFGNSSWAYMASDQRPRRVGDLITIVVYQNAEARQSARNAGGNARTFDGGLTSGSIGESAQLSWNGSYTGVGEARRSESLVTQLSAAVTQVLDNGDLQIEGQQLLFVNGEETTVHVRGRIRPSDIGADNQVLSTRIADAQINYDGHGFVSRNARPGLIHRLFSFLGIGG
jgi:flagellar L-ring protein precursor FlgH